MYVPKEFSVKNNSEIDSFIQNHPFISLITNSGDFPIATHLPVIAKKQDTVWIIEGHLSLANTQNLAIQNNSNALCILLGSHSYVSSSVYSHENVPTWNYQAVHLYGQLESLSSEELDNHLAELVFLFEKERENPLDFMGFSKPMIESYKKEIIGFRLKVEKIEAAFKLSQNRNEIDKQAIISDLEKCPYHGAKDIANIMKNKKPH
jgi:transcriptional regulator